MTPNSKKADILCAVARGETLAAVATSLGMSPSNARNLLSRLCREICLPDDIAQIRLSPEKYITKLDALKLLPQYELRKELVRKLVVTLKVKTSSEITPSYMANITAAQLLNNGITPIAVVEIQEWLCKQQHSLKKCPPKTPEEIITVRRAIAILDVFCFDTRHIRNQLSFLNTD